MTERSDRPESMPGADELESLDEMSELETRVGETDDPTVAAEEGLTWIPPTDPPVRPGDDGEPEVAAGFGTTADDEPFDADHHAEPVPERDERTARVEEALRADARTTALVDRLSIDTDGARVTIAGSVDDLDDEDAVLAVVEGVPGVAEVVDRLVVASLERAPARD